MKLVAPPTASDELEALRGEMDDVHSALTGLAHLLNHCEPPPETYQIAALVGIIAEKIPSYVFGAKAAIS